MLRQFVGLHMKKTLVMACLIGSVLASPAWAGAKCRAADGQWHPYDSPQCQPSGSHDAADAPSAPLNPWLARAAVLAAMTHVQQFELRVTEHVVNTGQLPASNQDLGLPPRREYSDKALQSLGVTAGGIIVAQFNERSGVRDGQIKLVPDQSKPHMGLLWTCETPSFADIGSWMPNCTFVGR